MSPQAHDGRTAFNPSIGANSHSLPFASAAAASAPGAHMGAGSNGSLTVVCAWCGRAQGARGWHATPDGYLDAALVSHGVCPECYEQLVAAL